jgi:hypothetical protein
MKKKAFAVTAIVGALAMSRAKAGFLLLTVKINTFCLVPINHSLPGCHRIESSACSCHRNRNVACLMNKLKRCSISAIKTDNSCSALFFSALDDCDALEKGHEESERDDDELKYEPTIEEGKATDEEKSQLDSLLSALPRSPSDQHNDAEADGGGMIAIRNNGVSLMQFARGFCACT